MRRVVLGVALAVCLSGCTNSALALTYEQWKQSTAPMYLTLDIKEAEEGVSTYIGSDQLKAVEVPGLYVRSRAVTALGPTAPELLGVSDWNTVQDRYTAAVDDDDVLQASFSWANPTYVAYEIAWADKMTDMLTEEQREKLADRFFGAYPLSTVTPDQVELIDLLMMSWAWVMWGRDVGVLSSEMNNFLQPYQPLCDQLQDADGWDYALFLMAFPPGMPTVCTAEQQASLWENIAATMTDATALQGSGQSFKLLLLEHARETHFPDNQAYHDKVTEVFNALSTTLTQGELTFTTNQLASLQATAFLLGEEYHPTDDQMQMLTTQTIDGDVPRGEYFTGPALHIPIIDARLLGSPLDLSEEFLGQLDPLEYLAILVASGQGITEEDLGYLADIEKIDFKSDTAALMGMIDVVSSWMLLSADPEASCAQQGLDLVGSTLDSLDVEIDPTTVALANRLFDQCERDVPSQRRDYVDQWREKLALLADTEPSLTGLYAYTRLQCASQPESVDVGENLWSTMSAFVHEDGGVLDEWGFMSLKGVHYVLTMMETSQQTCLDTGLLSG
ncbi:MAG: hypothetical protein FWG15_03075 [Propionibacteriaceae bacterium]|nr:hypothetical protein [Propionibacteriaceae bacterium]